MSVKLPPLNKRLATVAELVEPCGRIIDVGTDHAFLPLNLILTGKANTAICSDINRGPLDIAAKNIDRYCPGFAETVLSDGLKNIPYDKSDCVVIAGMGGETIVGILEAENRKTDERCFILQPMTRIPYLRAYLAENGFGITGWKLAEDRGRVYECIRVSKNGRVEEESIFLEVGRPDGQPQELYRRYIEGVACNIEKELSGLKRAAVRQEERITELENILTGLSALKGEIAE